MSKGLVAVLVVTNILTGSGLLYYYREYTSATSDVVSDAQRAHYGPFCVEHANNVMKDNGFEGEPLTLARSWKKHGQLVFEVANAYPAPTPEGGTPLCTVDVQSGQAMLVMGAEKDRWMFY